MGSPVYRPGLRILSPEPVLSLQDPLVLLIQGFNVLVVETLLFELVELGLKSSPLFFQRQVLAVAIL